MKGYINDLLTKYNHPYPAKPQHSPNPHTPIDNGKSILMAPIPDTSPILPAPDIKRIQGIIGSLLYYARAVDNKLLATLSTISAQQLNAIARMAQAVNQLLDVATYPSDGITY